MSTLQQLARTTEGRIAGAQAAAATFMFKMRCGYGAEAFGGVDRLTAAVDQSFGTLVREEIQRLIPKPLISGWDTL